MTHHHTEIHHDEYEHTWPMWVLIGIGSLVGLAVLGFVIYCVIRLIRKRNRNGTNARTLIEAEESSSSFHLSSIIIGPSDPHVGNDGKHAKVLMKSTRLQLPIPEPPPKTEQSSAVGDEMSAADNKSVIERSDADEVPEKVKEVTVNIQSTPKPVTVEADTHHLSQPPPPVIIVLQTPPPKAAPPKKKEPESHKIASKESHQEPSSKVDHDNVSKESKESKEEDIGVAAVKKNETPKKSKVEEKLIKKDVGKKAKEDDLKTAVDDLPKPKESTEEEDLKETKRKKQQDEKKAKIKKEFDQKADKKKKQKKGNKKLKAFDSKESTSDPPNSADIYIKTVKPEEPSFISRSELPSPSSTKGSSIWSVLRNSVGKDLSRVTVPIHFNEPLSYLQRLAEYMEYISLIKDASACKDPVKRLELVSAFALSNISSNNVRLSKPFNPLLHETFELSKPDLGFKFIAEQVSHHPPISAFHSQGDEFEFYGNVEPKVKFWGRSLEDNPDAFFTLVLKAHNETYTWKAASFSLHNLIMGKMYISLTGCMAVKCQESNLQTKIKFRGAQKQAPDTLLLGEILKGKKPIRTIYGNWTQYIATTSYEKYTEFKLQWEKEYKIVEKHKNFDMVTLFPESRLLWRIHKKPSTFKENYNLTYFSLLLNETLPDSANLPKTDTRFRPDIRQMEDGNLDVASQEKERLEEKQRAAAKEKEGHHAEPLWFSLGSDKGSGKSDAYIFNGKYWKKDFSHCDDIY